jgi:RimJ/RimL family protein N-acetyltransferase
MGERASVDVRLELWSPADFPVLEQNNTPEMTRYLGGPESVEALLSRHQRYLRLNASGEARMFTIRASGASQPVGTVGYWKSEWDHQSVWETGWAIDTPYQGRGFATSAMKALLRDAAGRDAERHLVYADPLTTNSPSNALCARLGFEPRGERDVEYPRGRMIHVNVWVFDLRALDVVTTGVPSADPRPAE